MALVSCYFEVFLFDSIKILARNFPSKKCFKSHLTVIVFYLIQSYFDIVFIIIIFLLDDLILLLCLPG